MKLSHGTGSREVHEVLLHWEEVITMSDLKIGKVTHYYDKISVAVIALSAALGVGEVIRFVRGGEDMFEQKVTEMQIEHEKIQKADKGQVIGLKTDQPLREGAEVYKVG